MNKKQQPEIKQASNQPQPRFNYTPGQAKSDYRKKPAGSIDFEKSFYL
jgi:hypothetical protein